MLGGKGILLYLHACSCCCDSSQLCVAGSGQPPPLLLFLFLLSLFLLPPLFLFLHSSSFIPLRTSLSLIPNHYTSSNCLVVFAMAGVIPTDTASLHRNELPDVRDIVTQKVDPQHMRGINMLRWNGRTDIQNVPSLQYQLVTHAIRLIFYR